MGMREKAEEIIAKHSARASTRFYSTEELRDDITLALGVEYSRGWDAGQAHMMPIIEASNAVCERAVTKAEYFQEQIKTVHELLDTNDCGLIAEPLLPRVSDLVAQRETFGAEHDENVRLHFENVELKAQLKVAVEALKYGLRNIPLAADIYEHDHKKVFAEALEKIRELK